MRIPRIKLSDRTAVYHCISRIVGGQFLLDDIGKEKLRQLLWKQAAFCGVDIITYCLMSNHFHVLARISKPDAVGDSVLKQRVEQFYGKKALLTQLINQSLKQKGSIPEDVRQSLLERMGDVSVFIKELKQRFSRWYNKQHGRFGTLWAERFKSVLVEDKPSVVRAVAAYIDLNPIRAGIVADPKEYRFCGYAEAVAGNAQVRSRILNFEGNDDWRKAGAQYRKALFVGAGVSGSSSKEVLSRKQIFKVLEQGGELSEAEVLRLRIRYMSDGVALGSRSFVNEVFTTFRDRFGAKRKSGARSIRKLPFSDLCTLRALRVSAIE